MRFWRADADESPEGVGDSVADPIDEDSDEDVDEAPADEDIVDTEVEGQPRI